MRTASRLGLFACIATAAFLVGCKSGGRTEGTATTTKACTGSTACEKGTTCCNANKSAEAKAGAEKAGCTEAKTDGKACCPVTGKPMN